MIKKYYSLFQGYINWKHVKNKYKIDDHTVVIVLPENRIDWNDTAIRYLSDYMKRKSAKRAIVLCVNESEMRRIGDKKTDPSVSVYFLNSRKMRNIMSYYCLYQFFDNIVFFYLNYPKDNKSEYILDTTDVDMKELVCMSFYRLRKVPQDV